MALQVQLQNDTVWLTQAQMAELFGKERSVISKHISNVFKEGELDEKKMCKKCTFLFLTNQLRFIASIRSFRWGIASNQGKAPSSGFGPTGF